MAQKQQRREKDDESRQPAHDGTNVIPLHVQPRVEGSLRQTVDGRAVNQEIERMQRGVARTGRVAVQVSSGNAAPVKFFHPLARALAQLVDRTELDRRRRTSLGASRDETVSLAIVTERTLVRVAVEGAASD